MTAEKFFTSTTDFSIHIEKLAINNDISHLEALVLFCEESGAEYDTVAALISPTLKQKVYDEAVTVYAMPKQTSVTLDDI